MRYSAAKLIYELQSVYAKNAHIIYHNLILVHLIIYVPAIFTFLWHAIVRYMFETDLTGRVGHAKMNTCTFNIHSVFRVFWMFSSCSQAIHLSRYLVGTIGD